MFTYLRAILIIYSSFLYLVDANSQNINDLLLSDNYEFIDLSHPFDGNTIYWPNKQSFVYSKKVIKEMDDGTTYAENEFATSEHGGTHLDAPYHFNEKGERVGLISLEKLIVPLIIADVSSQVNDDPNFVLYKHHLDHMINDNFGKPCVIVFKFGWSKFIHNRQQYLGLGANNTLNFPGVSAEVMEWITSSYKNIVGVGVDVSSVDPGSSTSFSAHKIGAAAGLYNIENVNLNRPVPEYGCTAIVMPMKLTEGTGAPARFVALCPKKKQSS
ncbi:unnamed protein product [Leptidea sinapis]|uniref:Cyclase n=1 Tax=Leptidea sinapis TaxID=189913 RepID=A0A5E4QHI2_9NEOP|nr:unnamed protein product [Leptidea sinapis]